jgi:hypothetical protein
VRIAKFNGQNPGKRLAMSKNWMPLIRRLHFEIHLAFCSGMVALLIMFALFVAPNIRAYQAAYEAVRASELSSENDMYCRRWNFIAGTNAYRSCLDDLHTLRKSIENRAADENDF